MTRRSSRSGSVSSEYPSCSSPYASSSSSLGYPVVVAFRAPDVAFDASRPSRGVPDAENVRADVGGRGALRSALFSAVFARARSRSYCDNPNAGVPVPASPNARVIFIAASARTLAISRASLDPLLTSPVVAPAANAQHASAIAFVATIHRPRVPRPALASSSSSSLRPRPRASNPARSASLGASTPRVHASPRPVVVAPRSPSRVVARAPNPSPASSPRRDIRARADRPSRVARCPSSTSTRVDV